MISLPVYAGARIPNVAPCRVAENFNGGLSAYTVVSGNSALFTVSADTYGNALQCAVQDTATVAAVRRTFTSFEMTRVRLRFRVDGDGADDAAGFALYGSSAQNFVVVPRREAAFDASRRCHIYLFSEEATTPAALTIGVWYEVVVEIIAGAGASTYEVTNLSTLAVVASGTFAGNYSGADVDEMQFRIDAAVGTTCPTTYGSICLGFVAQPAPPPAPTPIPVPLDDNIVAGNEGTSTAGWSITSGSLTQSGSSVRLTGNAAIATLSLAAPTSNDYVLLVSMAANYVAGQYGYLNFRDGTTNVFDLILGYNYETGAAQLGTISTFNYPSSTGNNIATGVIYSTAQEFAIHVDRDRSCVNLFYREPGTGKWDFCGSYAYSSGYGSLDDVQLVTSPHASQWVEYDWILYSRPNYIAIGDSICAGHNFFDPDPSVYGGEDNYASTWMKHCLIGQSLRNNLIVNKGIGGQSSTQTQARISEATASSPRVVFLHASTNDEALGVSKATRSTNIQNGVTSINAAGADCVLLNAVYGTSAGPDNTPSPDLRDYMLDWWDNYRPSLSPAPTLSIDIMQPLLSGGFMNAAQTESDGLHPSISGYQLVGEYVETFG